MPLDRTAAERQRRHRERKRTGVRIVPVEVDFETIDTLADAGLVDWNTDDPREISTAIIEAIRRWSQIEDVTRDGFGFGNRYKQLAGPIARGTEA